MMSKRLKFFFSHFLLSCVVASLVMVLVFLIWYPSPLADAVGVTEIVLLLLTIDIILGPLLSWFIYKEGKKTLKFDLTVIIFIQIAALSYGVYSIEKGRPAWLVFHANRFELVRKNDIILEKVEQAQPQFQHVPWSKLEFIAVGSGTSVEQQQNDMFTEVMGGISLAQQPERYVEFIDAKRQVQQRALSLSELEHYNKKQEVENFLKKYPKADAWLPLKANALDMVVLINKEKAEVVKVVDLRPWK